MEKEENEVRENIHTRIWSEEAESDNPFFAAICYCAGYDVYGDLLGKIRWSEYMYLLIKQERPTQLQSALLESLAVSLANPGPRDHSVQAAMSASAGGSTAASSLMAALAVGAGQFGGAREVYLAMENWRLCGRNLTEWENRLKDVPGEKQIDIWPDMEHPPGFHPYGNRCPTPVMQTLSCLAGIYPAGAVGWLLQHRTYLEGFANCPLAMPGVAAAALIDLHMNAQEGEMIYLLLRLPGAAAHALEQYMQWKKFPYFKNGLVLTNDPGK